jgi:hypothetical protein
MTGCQLSPAMKSQLYLGLFCEVTNPARGTLTYTSDRLTVLEGTHSAVATVGLLTTVDFSKLPGRLSVLALRTVTAQFLADWGATLLAASTLQDSTNCGC